MIDLISLGGAGYGQHPSFRSVRRTVPRLRLRQSGRRWRHSSSSKASDRARAGLNDEETTVFRIPSSFLSRPGNDEAFAVTSDLIGSARRLFAQSQLFPNLAGFQESHNCLNSLFAAAESDLHFPSLLNKVSSKVSQTFTRFSRMPASTRTLTHPSEGCQLTAIPDLFSRQLTDNLAPEWPSTGKSRR